MLLRNKWIHGAIALLAMVAWVGCNNSANNGGAKQVAQHEDHAHPEEGPHHGHLIELGAEEYHAELTHDDATKTVTVYLLDSSAKKAVAIAETELVVNLVVDGAPRQAKLAAAPQEGDPAGQSSRFSLTDEKLLDALEAPKTTGRINVTIGGKPYTGQIEHHEHDDHKKK